MSSKAERMDRHLPVKPVISNFKLLVTCWSTCYLLRGTKTNSHTCLCSSSGFILRIHFHSQRRLRECLLLVMKLSGKNRCFHLRSSLPTRHICSDKTTFLVTYMYDEETFKRSVIPSNLLYERIHLRLIMSAVHLQTALTGRMEMRFMQMTRKYRIRRFLKEYVNIIL